MDERRRGLSGRTLRRLRAEADREVEVVYDTPKRERFPRARNRPPRPSRHDVEWKDVAPALERPARPWDRPLPRPTMKGSRTHGRGPTMTRSGGGRDRRTRQRTRSHGRRRGSRSTR